ncbi:MAG: helix-turn-helix domain-containing protein [Acidimicrobiales bacterium]
MPDDVSPGEDRERITLGPQNLRGLAHPLRLRLLGLLREDGPSTATKLAERVGQSSGATSYHLRQLADYGFITEDPERTNAGRERWWKAAHRSTDLPKAEIRETPLETEGFLRALAAELYHKIDAFITELQTMPEEWDESSTLSDTMLRLTAEEATELRRELHDLMRRYREDRPGVEAPAGAERVILQVQLMPELRANESTT